MNYGRIQQGMMQITRILSIVCLLIGMTGTNFSILRGDENDSDDFFAPDPAAAETEKKSSAAPPFVAAPVEKAAAETSPAENASSETIAAKTPVSEPSAAEVYPIDAVIPGDSLLIFRTIRLSRLNDKGKYLFEQIGFGKLSPIDWLNLSPLSNLVSALDLKRSAAVVYLNEQPSNPPVPVVFLPTADFGAMVTTLGAASVPEEGTAVELEKPAGWSALFIKGYAALFESKYSDIPARLKRTASFAPERYSDSGLKNPDFTLEITERGVRSFASLIHSAANDFYPVLFDSLSAMDQIDGDMKEQVAMISARTDDLLRRMGTNLRSARFDFRIIPTGIVTAVALRPYPDTPLARQIADTGGPSTPTLLNGPEFLKVVPERPAPLSGQTDVTPEAASRWQAPFNRIRHIEYSFALPARGELLAESWCFFLEVDDTDAFVEELIVPKAQLIGSHIGAEKLGDFGARLLGNIAARRQAAGRPMLFSSPEEAASRGEELGASLGGAFGANIGEKEAMKTYDFEGYKLLISDLVLYAQKMKEIRAKERGEQTRPPVLLDGEPTLRIFLGQVLSGLENGSLEDMIQDRYGDKMSVSPDETLLARRNLILVLDSTHLLIVPGNESVLRSALEKWQRYISEEASAAAADELWQENWDALCAEMNDPEAQILRSAGQIDLLALKKDADFVRRAYAPKMPVLFTEPLPQTLSKAMTVSTTGPDSAFFYAIMKNDLIRTLKEQLLKKKNAAAKSEASDGQAEKKTSGR